MVCAQELTQPMTVLAEGTEDNIHELDKDEALRVDAQGSNFIFHINDEVVGQAR